MKKFIHFFGSLLFLPVAIVFLLYIYWLFTIPIGESYITGLTLLAIHFAGTIFVRLSEKHRAFSILILLILLPISIYTAVLEFWASTWIITDLGMHSHLIGLAIAVTLLVIDAVITIQKNAHLNSTVALSLFLFIVTLPFFTLNFGYFVVYYSSTEITEKVQFENSTYLIVDAKDLDFHSFETFYKCPTRGLPCEPLYSSYSSMGWRIIIDKQNKEVSIFQDGTSSLVYTDGKNPRAYTGTGGKLRDHSYYLSEQCNNLNNDKGFYECESYTYIPYKCNIKGIMCKAIPIQYTVDYSGSYYWAENDSKNEISLYDDNDVLIFTYGTHSRCYVDGCIILQ